MTRISLLLANERSGTHFLRSVIANGGNVWSPGEVCNAKADNEEDNPFSYFLYRQAERDNYRGQTYPTAEHTHELTKRYFNFVREHCESLNRQVALIDIKYGHLFNFECFWRHVDDPPLLISYAISENIPIVHLVRKKVYETAISEMYAKQTGVWRLSDYQQGDQARKIRIDKQELELRANRINASTNAVRKWLASVPSHLEVTYEELSTEGQLDAFNKVTKFLDISPLDTVESSYVKIMPRYADCIENVAELEDLLGEEL